MRGGRLSFPGGRCSDHPGELLVGVCVRCYLQSREEPLCDPQSHSQESLTGNQCLRLPLLSQLWDKILICDVSIQRKYQGLQS